MTTSKGIKRSEIDARAAKLGEMTGRELHVGTWSPGDGWTRYTLTDKYDQPVFGHRYYTKGEMYEVLGFGISVAYAMKQLA